MTTAPGADELRLRRLLVTRGLAYNPGDPMDQRPVTPTRIIPAGAPLPHRPPEPGEIPPWRTPPAPPVPPPPDPPAEVIHRHIHEVLLVPAEPAPAPTRWDRLWAWLRTLGHPWQLVAALAAAVVPIPGVGYSLGTTWAYVVHQTRLDHGVGWGYALAGSALAAAGTALARRGGALRLALLAVAFVGGLGAISLFDPITALTGVHR
jgi:hypothetical protein